MLKKYEKKSYLDVIPQPEFPKLLKFGENKKYIRDVLLTVGLTSVKEEYVDVEELSDDARFFDYLGMVNQHPCKVASHLVIENFIKKYGKDYRFDNKVVSFVPSLIFVMDDIEIIPKQSIKEIGNDKPTNTPTPTNPEDTDVESANRPKPTIPQTGYVIWPFYYVFVIAMVCLLLSIITKHKKVFGIISLVLFLLCFIVFIFKDTEEMESNKQIETSLEEVKSVINSNQENTTKNNQDISYQFDIYSEINDKVEMDSIEIKGQEYVGILVIPSLNLELPIMKDWDYDKLKISPCRYKGSIYTNDFIIAGHNYKKHFTPIKKMNIGEKAYFLDIYENRYEYELLEIEVLGKEDVEYLENTTYDLTLFTCTNGGKDRSVLRFEKK